MTSIAYLKMEVYAHSALAVTGRIRLALEAAGMFAGLCAMTAYIPFQVFRTWRKMRALATFIERGHHHDAKLDLPAPTDAQLRHALTSLWELHDAIREATASTRDGYLLFFVVNPMLAAIERDNATLFDFLDDAELRLSPEFRNSVDSAIAALKPPTGTDWRATLESMRH